MNRRSFLVNSIAAGAAGPLSSILSGQRLSSAAPATGASGVAVLPVDTDSVTASIDKRIYGQFLEHINHSVVDGLFGEQIRGCGFEGEDFKWEPFADRGSVELADVELKQRKRAYASASRVAAPGSLGSEAVEVGVARLWKQGRIDPHQPGRSSVSEGERRRACPARRWPPPDTTEWDNNLYLFSQQIFR